MVAQGPGKVRPGADDGEAELPVGLGQGDARHHGVGGGPLGAKAALQVEAHGRGGPEHGIGRLQDAVGHGDDGRVCIGEDQAASFRASAYRRSFLPWSARLRPAA
ncbi:hypothetical protein MRA01_16440 [Methylobacterium radiotolerans]|nr:hypothetical protein MRA01_16440 [Methylobacterium radiotolerans]